MRSNNQSKTKPMNDDMRAVLKANLSGLTIVTKRLNDRLEAKVEPDEGAIETQEEPIG